MSGKRKVCNGRHRIAGATEQKYGGDPLKEYEAGSISAKTAVCKRVSLQDRRQKYSWASRYFPRKYNTAIFIHGCFWHRHQGCKYAYAPKSRVEFWQKKFDDNVRRDAVVRAELQERGVKCLIVWECTITQMMKTAEFEDLIVDKCISFLFSDEQRMEL